MAPESREVHGYYQPVFVTYDLLMIVAAFLGTSSKRLNVIRFLEKTIFHSCKFLLLIERQN